MKNSQIPKDLIPNLPMEFTEDNTNAIDFGFCGVVAIATSHIVNFCYYLNKELKQSFSISPSSSVVTCIKFHPRNSVIAIGCIDGSLFLYDVDLQKYIGYYVTNASQGNDNSKCIGIVWSGSTFIVLYEKNQLSCYSYAINEESKRTKKQYNITSVWDFQLEDSYDNIAIDVCSYNKLILSSSKTNSFLFYDLRNIASNGIPGNLKPVFLESKKRLMDAQFHAHIPGYVFLLMEDELLLYDEQSQIILTLFQANRSNLFFSEIIQLVTNHKLIFLLSKEGSLLTLKLNDSFRFDLEEEFNCSSPHIKIKAVALFQYDDSVMVWLLHPMNICLYDVELKRVRTMIPFYSSKIICSAVNSQYIVTGMSNGVIVVHSLYDPQKKLCFRISEEHHPITSVFIHETKKIVIWHMKHMFGFIDIEKKTIHRSNTKYPVLKVLHSPKGGLIVQRGQTALSVFIHRHEYPLVVNQAIVDFCFNAEECDSKKGKFLIATEGGELQFFEYSEEERIKNPFLRLKPQGVAGSITSLAWSGDIFATGTKLGTVSFMNIKTGIMNAFSPLQSPITHLQIIDNKMYFVSKNRLCCGPTGINISSFLIESFSQVPNLPLFACLWNGYTSFIKMNDFRPIYDNPLVLRLPHQLEFSIERVKDNMYTSQEVRDLVLALKGKNNLRINAKSCYGDNPLYLSEIALSVAKLSKNRTHIYHAYIYLDQFDKASQVMFDSDPNSNDFLASVLFGIAAWGQVQGTQKEKIMEASSKLFALGKDSQAALLMRLVKADDEAFEVLLKKNKINQCLKFVRLMDEKERKAALFEVGCYYYTQKRLEDAALLFVAASEGHPALECVYSLGNIMDSFIVRNLMIESNILNELSEERKNMINLMDLTHLNKKIDKEFAIYCEKMSIRV